MTEKGTLILKKDNIPIWLISVVLLVNSVWIFKFKSFNWWAIYLIATSVFYLVLLGSSTFRYRSPFKKELILVVAFIAIGVLSSILNTTDLIDVVYTLIFRLSPILFIGLCFSYIRSNTTLSFGKVLGRALKIFTPFLFILVVIGLVQYLIFGYTVDELGSLTGSAHKFSFLVLFIGLYCLLFRTNKTYILPLFLAGFVLTIVADYKLGIIIYILSLVLSITFTRINLKHLIILASIIVLIVVGFPYYINLLPSKFQLLAVMISDLDQVILLDSVNPPNFELLKGYIQLFHRLLVSPADYIFGVGPGNYGTNIAIFKAKELSYDFIIYYRDLLDSQGKVSGSLLDRNNSLISLIAEFGIAGTAIYLWILISLLMYPIKLFIKTSYTKIGQRVYFCYLVTLFFFLSYNLVVPAIENGFYVAFLTLTGSLLILHTNDQGGKLK